MASKVGMTAVAVLHGRPLLFGRLALLDVGGWKDMHLIRGFRHSMPLRNDKKGVPVACSDVL